MRNRILTCAVLGLVAAVVSGAATAGSTTKRQRIAIAFHPQSGTFTLTPLTSGPLRRDSGTYSPCCWTPRFVTRDGAFTWKERITFVDITADYTVATAVWKITHGTGAYVRLEGHGREAAVSRTAENREVAAKAEGLVEPGR